MSISSSGRPRALLIVPNRRMPLSVAYCRNSSFVEVERNLVVEGVGVVGVPQRHRDQLVHPRLEHRPVGVVGGDVAPAGEGAPRHVAPLVVTDAPHQFLHAGQNVVVHANPVPRIVSRQGHHAFDDVVVGRRCAHLGGRGRDR